MAVLFPICGTAVGLWENRCVFGTVRQYGNRFMADGKNLCKVLPGQRGLGKFAGSSSLLGDYGIYHGRGQPHGGVESGVFAFAFICIDGFFGGRKAGTSGR